MNEEKIIQELKKEGFQKVYVCEDKPYQFDESHSHPYFSKIIIVKGEMKVKIDDKEVNLNQGDVIEIKKDELHESTLGKEGCKFVIGERK